MVGSDQPATFSRSRFPSGQLAHGGPGKAGQVEPAPVDRQFVGNVGQDGLDRGFVGGLGAVAPCVVRAGDDVSQALGGGLDALQGKQGPAAWVHGQKEGPGPIACLAGRDIYRVARIRIRGGNRSFSGCTGPDNAGFLPVGLRTRTGSRSEQKKHNHGVWNAAEREIHAVGSMSRSLCSRSAIRSESSRNMSGLRRSA